MEVANKQLEEKIADGAMEDLDIENVDDCEGPIIEMVHILNNCTIHVFMV